MASQWVSVYGSAVGKCVWQRSGLVCMAAQRNCDTQCVSSLYDSAGAKVLDLYEYYRLLIDVHVMQSSRT